MMKNRTEISCEEVQQMLLAQDIGELDDPLKQHLESCQKCRKFQMLLTEVSNSTQVTAEENLQPDPHILKTLKKKLKAQTASTGHKQTGNFFESLAALFRRRIPVYQVLLAVFIAAIFYFSFTKINLFEAELKEPRLISKSAKRTVQPVEFPVQTQLDQTHQIGKSLAEDSMLAKFRVSIL